LGKTSRPPRDAAAAGVGAREWFIYYRIRQADAPGAIQAVLQFQRHLCRQHPGLQARLLCRPEAVDGVQTWMETYSNLPMQPACDTHTALQADIEAGAPELAPWLDGRRHVEIFEPRFDTRSEAVPPCAW
jgi:hypothetical protein